MFWQRIYTWPSLPLPIYLKIITTINNQSAVSSPNIEYTKSQSRKFRNKKKWIIWVIELGTQYLHNLPINFSTDLNHLLRKKFDCFVRRMPTDLCGIPIGKADMTLWSVFILDLWVDTLPKLRSTGKQKFWSFRLYQ